MARPATGSNGLPPALMIGCASLSGNLTNSPSPNRPANMLPFTKAARLPNIGRRVTAGSPGTSLVNAALAFSLGFGIFIDTAIILRCGGHARDRGNGLETSRVQRRSLDAR